MPEQHQQIIRTRRYAIDERKLVALLKELFPANECPIKMSRGDYIVGGAPRDLTVVDIPLLFAFLVNEEEYNSANDYRANDCRRMKLNLCEFVIRQMTEMVGSGEASGLSVPRGCTQADEICLVSDGNLPAYKYIRNIFGFGVGVLKFF